MTWAMKDGISAQTTTETLIEGLDRVGIPLCNRMISLDSEMGTHNEDNCICMIWREASS
jgi:hypothetical protein